MQKKELGERGWINKKDREMSLEKSISIYCFPSFWTFFQYISLNELESMPAEGRARHKGDRQLIGNEAPCWMCIVFLFWCSAGALLVGDISSSRLSPKFSSLCLSLYQPLFFLHCCKTQSREKRSTYSHLDKYFDMYKYNRTWQPIVIYR